MKYDKGGMPDLTGDGKVTRADVLKGRGVFKEGGKVSMKAVANKAVKSHEKRMHSKKMSSGGSCRGGGAATKGTAFKGVM